MRVIWTVLSFCPWYFHFGERSWALKCKPDKKLFNGDSKLELQNVAPECRTTTVLSSIYCTLTANSKTLKALTGWEDSLSNFAVQGNPESQEVSKIWGIVPWTQTQEVPVRFLPPSLVPGSEGEAFWGSFSWAAASPHPCWEHRKFSCWMHLCVSLRMENSQTAPAMAVLQFREWEKCQKSLYRARLPWGRDAKIPAEKIPSCRMSCPLPEDISAAHPSLGKICLSNFCCKCCRILFFCCFLVFFLLQPTIKLLFDRKTAAAYEHVWNCCTSKWQWHRML